MLVIPALALCALMLALPLATVCAAGAELQIPHQDDDGYGTAWYADPGEWHVAAGAPAVGGSRGGSTDEGYGTAWWADPGEWHVATHTAVQASRTQPRVAGFGTAWWADPGEWHVATDEPLASAR